MATANPAKALGLTDRGTLEVGKRADFAVVDAHNRVTTSFSAGQTVFSNGWLETGTLADPVPRSRAIKVLLDC